MKETLLGLLNDIRAAREQGAAAIEQRQRAHLAQLVAYARANSPYYRELYQGLPEYVDNPTLLPITTKMGLMTRFDDWVTDREVTLEEARSFVEDQNTRGELFLGKYLLAQSSGTRGLRAIYLMMDDWSGAIHSALSAYQALDWFPNGELLRVLTRDGGKATIVATSCNFPGVAGASGLAKKNPRAGKKNRIFSVQVPLEQLVAELNEFRPVALEGYASTVGLLASEQEAGRLHIDPMMVTVESEPLTASEAERIARIFNAKVGNIYACSECPGMGYSCEHGWLHIHSDWVILEPVDEHFRPTPAGEVSHTVLLSNLYNRAQPVLRYDLGDSVIQRPDPCPCGNPLPAIQVLGRAGVELVCASRSGEEVRVNLIPIGIEVDRVRGMDLFQLVQTSPTSIRVRLMSAPSSDPDQVWQGVSAQISKVLARYDLEHVTLVRAPEPPEQTPGGKYSVVLSQPGALAAD